MRAVVGLASARWNFLLLLPRGTNEAVAFLGTFSLRRSSRPGRTYLFLGDSPVSISVEIQEILPGGGYFLRGENSVSIHVKCLEKWIGTMRRRAPFWPIRTVARLASSWAGAILTVSARARTISTLFPRSGLGGAEFVAGNLAIFV